MAQLTIAFTLDDDPIDRTNGIGRLVVDVQVTGFSAQVTGFAQREMLAAFARQVTSPVLPQSGTTLDMGECRIEVLTEGSAGSLRVTTHLEDGRQIATLSFVTRHAPLDRFGAALAGVAAGSLDIARLEGE